MNSPSLHRPAAPSLLLRLNTWVEPQITGATYLGKGLRPNSLTTAIGTLGFSRYTRYGTALGFNGATMYNVSSGVNLSGGTKAFRFISSTVTTNVFLSHDGGGYHYEQFTSPGDLVFVIFDGGGKLTPGVSVSANTWTDIVVTWGDQGFIRIYKNGQFQGQTAAGSIASGAAAPMIGGRAGVGYINGSMAWFGQWDRPLTPSEIAGLSVGVTPTTVAAISDVGFPSSSPSAKPWLYRRSSSISRPYLQVA